MTRIATVLHSLRFKITLSVVVALAVGIGVVALLMVHQAERDTLAAYNQRQISETVRTGKVIAGRIADLQRALRVTASQLSPEVLADRDQLSDFIESKAVLHAMFRSLFVVSDMGLMVAMQKEGVRSVPNTDLNDRGYIQQVLGKGIPVISEPINSRVTGRPMVAFAHPLIRDGKTFGVLAGSLSLDSRELLADLVDDDQSGTLVAITDLDGRLLAHPDEKVLMSSVASLPAFSEAFDAWIATGSSAEPGGLALPQPSHVVSICAVPGANWIVWRAVPKDELLRPLQAARTQTLKLVAALLAVMSLASFITLTWLLRPLGQLAHRAQHLFDGSHALEAGWPPARGELGHLTAVLRRVVSERLEYQALNEEMLRKVSAIMGAAPIGIAFTREHRFELVSAEFCRLVVLGEKALLGRRIGIVFSDHGDFARMLEVLAAALAEGRAYEGEWTMRRGDTTTFLAQLRVCPMDETNKGAGLIWTLSDVTEQAASRSQLEWSAGHDALTGLANRKLLGRRLHDIFESRDRRQAAAVVVIDLDNFKPVNDAGGHAAGDAMLQRVAAAILSCVRSGDLVARTGGDEFALVLEGCSLDAAIRIAENVRLAIGTLELDLNEMKLKVGASLGVSVLDATMTTVESWVGQADALCYEAKRAGRGAVRTLVTLEADA